ncbi:MAG: restriction endonuclease [Porphyromonadaceae bacterium]|nr:restriction endonuclease [Porphyromonadaceae bacterium]MBD9006600.1 restriction endonuclease [Porphyromonadaceae bacterium]
MDISIDNKSYSYSFIGETLHRPLIDTFGINQNDISKYKEHEEETDEYKKRLDNMTFYISMIPGVIAYIAELIYIFNNPKVSFPHNWFLSAVMAIFPFLLAPLAVAWQACLLSLFIPKKAFKKIALKIVGIAPALPPKWEKVNDYKMKCEQFKEKEIDYLFEFPGIHKTDYDLSAFGAKCIESFLKEVISFTNIQNGIIYKENLRQEQRYWFDLNPFEFEKEVAYWFEQQGYNSIVTKKTGDGGVDIIISKGKYKAYVQCKRYKTSKVDRPTLNALYGVVCADNVDQGIVVCLLGITDEANEFAKKVGIKIITVDELAPKDDLFQHKIKKETLCAYPVQNNKYWVEVGNFKLNTNAYRRRENVLEKSSKWNNSELYHPVEYKGIYLCLYCHQDDFVKFSEWYKLKEKASYTRKYKKKLYRRNRYWRY